jgi:hypothetical protein
MARSTARPGKGARTAVAVLAIAVQFSRYRRESAALKASQNTLSRSLRQEARQVKSFSLGRYALSTSVATAMLAGCG